MTEEHQTKVVGRGPSPSELLNAEANDKTNNEGDDVQQQREEMITSPQMGPTTPKRPSPADSLEKYNYKLAVESWDQIGSLTSEVASSMLSQLAENMSDQMKEENRAAKRRKIHYAAAVAPFHCQAEPTLVSSDEETIFAEPAPIPRSLSLKIDRMGRMSKYLLQIERYHRFLRDEMVAIREDDA
jgi:hypothetical protein